MKAKKKHTTGKDIKRANLIYLIGGILAFVFGIYILLMISLNPTPRYEDLKESRITVDSVKWYGGGRGNGFYGLNTANGDRYRLSGDFDFSALEKKLQKGTEITVKWYSKDKLMTEKLYIEEIDLNGETLSAYTNDDRSAQIFAYIGGGTMLLLGVGGLLFYYHRVKAEIKQLPKKYRNQ